MSLSRKSLPYSSSRVQAVLEGNLGRLSLPMCVVGIEYWRMVHFYRIGIYSTCVCTCGNVFMWRRCECMWGPEDSLTCPSCTPLSSAPLCFFETGSLTDLDLPKQGGRMSSEPTDSSCRHLLSAGIIATHYGAQIFLYGFWGSTASPHVPNKYFSD